MFPHSRNRSRHLLLQMALSFFSNLCRRGSLNSRNLTSTSTTRSLHDQIRAESMENPVATSISDKLMKQFNPAHLQVINESYMHNVPKGAETHFKVVVVSEKFENLPLIQRHRLVNEALTAELHTGVHALSIQVSIKRQQVAIQLDI